MRAPLRILILFECCLYRDHSGTDFKQALVLAEKVQMLFQGMIIWWWRSLFWLQSAGIFYFTGIWQCQRKIYKQNKKNKNLSLHHFSFPANPDLERCLGTWHMFIVHFHESILLWTISYNCIMWLILSNSLQHVQTMENTHRMSGCWDTIPVFETFCCTRSTMQNR